MLYLYNLPTMIHLSLTEDDYFLPEDGVEARERFLQLLGDFNEIWIAAFGFTLQPMFDDLKAADAAGKHIHLLLDHSQSTGRAEAPKVKALAESLEHGDLTITTAGVNSGKPSQIWHFKAIVAKNSTGDDICWEGSTNFSDSAWNQGNSARIFSSSSWADIFRMQFELHRAWARQFEPQYQVQKEMPLGHVATFNPDGSIASIGL